MKYLVPIIMAICMGFTPVQSTQKISVDLSIKELEVLVKVLDNIVQERAPRIDAANVDSPEYPVFGSDAADLELIKSALCSLKSLLESISAVIGTLESPGSCFPAITTIMDIDNATLDIIAWLKTLMRELRGVCP